MKRIALFLLILIALSFEALSLTPIKELLPSLSASQIESLKRGEDLFGSSYNNDLLALVPADSVLKKEVDRNLQVKKGFTVIEGILTPYPEGWKDLSEKEIMLRMVNASVRISTMDGLTYQPAQEKRKILFENSSLLSSPDKKDRIPDPVFTKIPEYLEYYAYQEDSSYGKEIFHTEYWIQGDELCVTMENHNAITVMGIKVIAPENMRLCLALTKTEEGIYTVGMATVVNKDRSLNVMGVKVDIEGAVLSRIIALKDWYQDQIHK